MPLPPSRQRSPGPGVLPATPGLDREARWPFGPPTGRLPGVGAACRAAAFVVLTLLCIPVQAVLVRLPGRAKVLFARTYWRNTCRIMGVRVRILGTPAHRGLGSPGRPVVFAANHSSWLDIPVLGAALHAPFVAKDQVATWPGVSIVARLGRTVFVSRRARDTGRERDDMRARLAAGDDLILFPEGTSSDGNRVLPFRSAFFSIAEALPDGPAPLVQPLSLVYDRESGLATGRATRSRFAWYGDMDLAPHFWSLARLRGPIQATILLHKPIDPATTHRKSLSAMAFNAVNEGAAQLRQNRATVPETSRAPAPDRA